MGGAFFEVVMKRKWTQEYKRKYAKAYRTFYYLSHKEQIKAYSKMFHKKMNYKYQKAWQQRNPEKITEYSKENYSKNKLAYLMYYNFKTLMKQDNCL